MCHQVAIILTDFTNRKYTDEVPNDEQLEFIDYCAAVLAGEAPFYLPDEVSPFEVASCEQSISVAAPVACLSA